MGDEAHAEHFPHGADVGIRGIGATRDEAFAQAAVALSAAMIEVSSIRPERRVHFECEAPSDVLLLVDWLNAVIYRMAVDHLVFGRFDVAIDGHRLRAEAWGEVVDPLRHAPAVEPKGATYTEVKVEHHSDGHWSAQCVIDV